MGTGGKERPQASAQALGSARAWSRGADLGTQVEFIGSPRCVRRWHELPAGNVSSGGSGFEKWKAKALGEGPGEGFPKVGSVGFPEVLVTRLSDCHLAGLCLPCAFPKNTFSPRPRAPRPSLLVLCLCPTSETDVSP